MINHLLRNTLILSTLFLGACNVSNLQFPGVYKVPVQQGNIITQDMIDQLRPGMTRRQVIFVMGSPMVRDPFHQDRWDYVYNYQPGGGTRGQEMVTIYFEDDVLTQITGDYKPGQEAASETSEPPRSNNS